MKGWKTKTGAVCTFIAGILYACVDSCPVEEWKVWIKFGATILGAASVGLMGLGIGHKVEKASK
jgi:hypothetical protein